MTQQVTDRLITQAGPSDDVSNVQLDEVSVNPADIISRPLLVADACQSGATYRVPGKGILVQRTNTSWPSLICCCWISSMEQSANPAASLSHTDVKMQRNCEYTITVAEL